METSATDETTHWWRPAPSPGGLIGGLGVILSLLLAGGTAAALVGWAALPVPPAVMGAVAGLFLVLALALAYLLWGYLSIGYELGDRALVIRWAHRRDRIELTAITQVAPAIELIDEEARRWQRFWPGYYVEVRQARIGPVRVVATLPPRRQLLVTTESGHYAISPERPVLFIEEYGRLRRALEVPEAAAVPVAPDPGQGALRLAAAGWTSQVPIVMPARPTFDDEPDGMANGRAPLTERVEEPSATATVAEAGEPRQGLLMDPLSVALLTVAVALNVAMVGYILARYGTIPPSISLHWNVNGLPDRIGSPREIWTLPLITGLITLANFGLAWSVVRFDRFAARLLLVATCLVQLVAWVAVASLIRQ